MKSMLHKILTPGFSFGYLTEQALYRVQICAFLTSPQMILIFGNILKLLVYDII